MARVENQKDNTIVYGTDFADDLFNSKLNVKIFGYGSDDTIENRGYEVIIEAGDGNDSIYSDVYPSLGSENYRRATIYGGAGKDTVLVNDNETSLNAGADNDFISIFGNDRWENNTLQGGLGNDTIYGGKSNVIIYEEGDGNDTIFCGTSCDTIQIASNSDFTSVHSGNDIIINVGSGSMLLKNPSDIIITKASKFLNGTKDNDKISNDSSYKTVATDEGDDIIYNTGGRGTKLDGGADNDFIYNGGNDIITDYEKGKDKINLDSASISNFTTINKDVTFTLSNNNSLTLNNMADKQISFLSGSKTTKLTFTNNASLDGSEKGATLIPATTEFSAVNYSELVTINAEKVSSAVNIIGNNKANRIIAGNYGSTLNGSKGKDSLIGGNGSDIFIYENKSGNKVIQNYSFGDTISLVGAQLSDASIKGKDVVLKAGSKKITVKGATSQEITISEDGTTKFFVDNILYDEDKTSAILSPKFSAKTEKVFDSTVSYINASKAKKKLILNSDYSGSSTILGGKKNDSLTGNSGNDIIYGGKGNDSLYGSSGNDTLWGEAGKDKLYGGDGNNILIGGKGNDSLWGGNDTDTFIYSKGDGKDIIYGFDDTDILQITDTFSTTYNNSKSEISFKVGSTSNAIMLKNFTATNFNINNDSYQISGSTLVKK